MPISPIRISHVRRGVGPSAGGGVWFGPDSDPDAHVHTHAYTNPNPNPNPHTHPPTATADSDTVPDTDAGGHNCSGI